MFQLFVRKWEGIEYFLLHLYEKAYFTANSLVLLYLYLGLQQELQFENVDFKFDLFVPMRY